MAMVYDIFQGRIPNRLIFVGTILEILYLVIYDGIDSVLYGCIRMVLSFFVLFLIYQTSALGAGDLKLISMLSILLNWEELGKWLVSGLFFAAIMAVVYRMSKKATFPFAVSLFAGMLVTLIV